MSLFAPASSPTHARRPIALAIAGLLAVAGLLVPACHHSKSKDEPTKGSKGQSASLSPKSFQVNHDDWAKLGYRLDWVGYPFVGEDEDLQVKMVMAYDDLVVLQDRQSTVAALETTNGQTRWSTQLAGPLTKFVGINRDPDMPGTVLVSSESEVFAISSANGNVLSREHFARVINTQPVLAEGMLIAGTSTGEVLSHALGRSVKAWGFATVGAIDANPTPVGDMIGVVSQAGDVMLLSSGGSLAGRGRIHEGLDNNPVSEEGLLFVAGRDRSVWAFDSSGQFVWRYRTSSPLAAQPTAHGGVLYMDIPGQGMTAFEEMTGKVLWTSPNVNGTVIGSRAGKLIVQKGQSLTLVDTSRGDILERVSTPGVVKFIVDKFDDGRIYAVNDKANVAKFIPR
jgi:outer membrane protein assembly factor BamB